MSNMGWEDWELNIQGANDASEAVKAIPDGTQIELKDGRKVIKLQSMFSSIKVQHPNGHVCLITTNQFKIYDITRELLK